MSQLLLLLLMLSELLTISFFVSFSPSSSNSSRSSHHGLRGNSMLCQDPPFTNPPSLLSATLLRYREFIWKTHCSSSAVGLVRSFLPLLRSDQMVSNLLEAFWLISLAVWPFPTVSILLLLPQYKLIDAFISWYFQALFWNCNQYILLARTRFFSDLLFESHTLA